MPDIQDILRAMRYPKKHGMLELRDAQAGLNDICERPVAAAAKIFGELSKEVGSILNDHEENMRQSLKADLEGLQLRLSELENLYSGIEKP